MKLIKVQLHELELFLMKQENGHIPTCNRFSCYFVGSGLHLSNKMNWQEVLFLFCLLCTSRHNLDPKI